MTDKMCKIRQRLGLRWGSSRRSPRPLSRLGRGYPSPSARRRLRRLHSTRAFGTRTTPRKCLVTGLLLYSVTNWSALFLRTVNKHKKPDWIECLVACPSRPVLFQYRRLSDKTTHFDNMLFVVGLCSTQIPTSVSSYELSVLRTYPTLDRRRPSFTSRRCTHPKQSSAAYHVLRHFLSSALAWRHTSSNCVTHNYCYHAREVTLSFMDTLIALTYLLPEMLLVQDLGNYLSTKCQVKI